MGHSRSVRKSLSWLFSLALCYVLLLLFWAPFVPAQSPSPTPSPRPSPSATPRPSPSPSSSPEPTPAPTPTMTPTSTPTPTHGVPGANLPNLDYLRNVLPVVPVMPQAVPSTRCSPAQPDCNPTTGRIFAPAQASERGRREDRGRLLGSAGVLARLRPLHSTSTTTPLPHDQLLAWNTNQLTTRFLKFDTTREGTDTTGASLPLFQPQSGGSYDDFVMARLDPDNRIGTGSEDILSRNFNWILNLFGLPGRAGLDLGMSLSYNSLVWTRSGNYITYDADNGFPTPSFRLGFPVVYGQHYNSQTGAYGYLILMPSGSRVELRRVGSTNTYEAADSSYLQLIDNANGTLLVRSTDGTQLSYALTTNGYRCTQVKDRNGNYLTITNSAAGRILNVSDTLGRVFNFNYDANNNLTSISQTRGSGQYTWVTFGYTNLTLQTNFTGLTTIGLASGATLPVLSQVSLPDGTSYKFSYNSWGQVYKITSYAADSVNDNHPLNYVSYNLPLTSATAQTDCPRFTQRKVFAENWMSGAEVVTNYAVPVTGVTWTMPGGSQQIGTFSQVQTPDGVYQNVYSHSSGWDEGLPILVNTYDAQVVLQRQAVTSYTQDNMGVGYILNPRVTETNIYDPAGNRKRSSVSYSSFTLSCGTGCNLNYYLPFETKEYAANATDVLRTTQTSYNTSYDYTSRRIFGLPSLKLIIDTADNNKLLSKVEYFYDETGEFLVQQGTPIRHDSANYGASFVYRGNLTRTKRWDVINTSASLESRVGYNTTGLPTFMRDPLNHQTSISYTDSFSDVGNMNTYALPTTTTDPDGNQATSQYGYNVGVLTRKQGFPTNVASPANATGAYVTNSYDTVGRLYQVTNSFNTASTTYLYPTSSNVVQTYTTIQDGLPATVSAKLLDGAGQVRAIAAEHPGSMGGYVGQYFVYDAMGRQIQQTNPTEIYGSWIPAGDDAAGWQWTVQTYDWKGRPRVSTNQDGTTREATYAGCGCAGGEVVTMRDEVNRYSKVYHDVVGRAWKTEELNWNQTVYRTTTNSFNALDQVIQTFVQEGSSGSGQTTTMTYDGYGRLSTSHSPMQSNGTTTSISYNADDTVATKTDARGVVANFTYNNRRQTTGISYPNTAPSGVPETLPTTFAYDAAGNRTSMSDGLGSVSYQYDPLSRMTSESRTFTSVGTFTLGYGYNLAGQLSSITDPWNAQIGYTRDLAGKLTAVTGSGYANVSLTGYASQLKYRAWGALKSMTYGNGVPLSMTYTNRMQVSNYKLTSSSTNVPSPSMDIDYSYSADGRLRLSSHNDPTLDRAYNYDQVGRLVDAFTASEARSWVQTGNIGTTVDGPYRQNYTMDVWNNMTTKWGRSWAAPNSQTQTVNHTYSATTGRNTAWAYDADGRMLADGWSTLNVYDEAGGLRNVWGSFSGSSFVQDGDGQKAKKVEESTATYYLHSTVLGQTIAEIEGTSRMNGFVYADGQLIATQAGGAVGGAVFWQHTDPSRKSRRTTIANGDGTAKDEVDPFDVKLDPPGLNNHNTGTGGGGKSAGGAEARVASLMDLNMCDFAGMLVPCSSVEQLTDHVGSAHWQGIMYWASDVGSDNTVRMTMSKIDPIGLIEILHGEDIAIDPLFFNSSAVYFQNPEKPQKKRHRSRLNDPVRIPPQNPTPLDDAARLVELAMNVNQSCRDLFTSNVDPVKLLNDLRKNTPGVGSVSYSDLGGIRANGTVRNAGVSGDKTGVTMSINNNPAAPFQAGYRNAGGGSAFRAGLTKVMNNAITLIHELGHAAVRLYGNNASQIVNDGNDENKSDANSLLVFENCFVL